MAALLGSYSPNDVSVIVNGAPIEGFAEGTMVGVAYNSDAATLTEGADGTPAIAFKRGARGGTITLTLQQTSLGNNLLSALLQAQKFAASGVVTFSVVIRNAQGGEMHTMQRAVFQKEPDADFAGEISSREWAIIGQLSSNYAGNEV